MICGIAFDRQKKTLQMNSMIVNGKRVFLLKPEDFLKL